MRKPTKLEIALAGVLALSTVGNYFQYRTTQSLYEDNKAYNSVIKESTKQLKRDKVTMDEASKLIDELNEGVTLLKSQK